MLKNKTIVITGGTGSFGSHLTRVFLGADVNEVRIVSRDEKKQEDMRIELNDERLRFFIGDVRDEGSLTAPFRGADYAYHAAALKQVPSCEFYPLEAVKTNIMGTENVLNAAIKNGLERIVALSTDKAVYPINSMGQTKALMEKVVISKARSHSDIDLRICATRYGNVMASRGSVIPLFINQIKSGAPITVTDPKMTRFLMSIEESVDLVMYAFKNGKEGDIFVQKSPSCTIGQLVTVLSEIFESKSEIKTIGTRHGEKLFETLISREEMARAEDLDKYFRIPADNRNLNYANYFTEGQSAVSEINDYTSHNTEKLSDNELKCLLVDLPYIKKQLATG